MSESIQNIQQQVLDGLTRLIMYHLNNAANEQYAPSSGPDEMDHRIADGKARAEKYRTIRAQVENNITGILS